MLGRVDVAQLARVALVLGREARKARTGSVITSSRAVSAEAASAATYATTVADSTAQRFDAPQAAKLSHSRARRVGLQGRRGEAAIEIWEEVGERVRERRVRRMG